ncbi:MAG TPA: peptidylprolyl isomerase [Candidatus Poseidoniales archaeon]|nr:MAG TPA: peptidylprolyl isomerase [Candidatus Poseidoniales archaeon]HIH56971.1 peptidylprolyl isomerase [Candidatus Poseidoniaceae archaeon]|tara:strand:+ start:4648 stop:5121 length:474 start_codon:yes stop_codon:yes gene_type:complete
MTEIGKNTVARVHYTGTLPDSGEVFDSSEDREPLAFLVGHSKMIPGFERELMGAKTGDKVEFTLTAEDAYGPHNPDAVQNVPLEMFGGITPEVGMTLMSDLGPFRVSEISGSEITVDFNHALAGKSLTFNVEVVEVRAATDEEISHGHAHGPGGVQH